jgi:hypothetical protein
MRSRKARVLYIPLLLTQALVVLLLLRDIPLINKTLVRLAKAKIYTKLDIY